LLRVVTTRIGWMPVILDPDDEALWLDPGPLAPVKGLLCQAGKNRR